VQPKHDDRKIVHGSEHRWKTLPASQRSGPQPPPLRFERSPATGPFNLGLLRQEDRHDGETRADRAEARRQTVTRSAERLVFLVSERSSASALRLPPLFYVLPCLTILFSDTIRFLLGPQQAKIANEQNEVMKRLAVLAFLTGTFWVLGVGLEIGAAIGLFALLETRRWL
jgi:hypothetical protein